MTMPPGFMPARMLSPSSTDSTSLSSTTHTPTMSERSPSSRSEDTVSAALILVGAGDDGSAAGVTSRLTATATRTRMVTPAANLNDPAAIAAQRQYQLMSDGQWARHWELLHPDQRAQVPQDLYARCQ